MMALHIAIELQLGRVKDTRPIHILAAAVKLRRVLSQEVFRTNLSIF